MITRITKFKIEAESQEEFSAFMTQFKDELASVEGCRHFDVLKDKTDPLHLFMFMIWDDEEMLETFRNSELNKMVTGKIAFYSSEEPVSWTVETVFDPELMNQQKSLFD